MSGPNLTLIRKWHDALLSGEYKQGRAKLRDGGKFCCLGVACDISGVGKWRREHGLGHWVYGDGPGGGDSAFLPRSVSREFGFEHISPPLLVGDGAMTEVASILNDHEGYTFPQIAECIRRTWPEAFKDVQQ